MILGGGGAKVGGHIQSLSFSSFPAFEVLKCQILISPSLLIEVAACGTSSAKSTSLLDIIIIVLRTDILRDKMKYHGYYPQDGYFSQYQYKPTNIPWKE